MSFLRRLFGSTGPRDGSPPVSEDVASGPVEPAPVAPPPPAPTASCPYCAVVLEPPPVRNRLCPSCRRPIVVRRIEGRTVLLVDSVVPIFDRELQRAADEQLWTSQRDRWLGLAAYVRAPVAQRERLAEAHLSASVVDDCQALYLAAAERAVKAARTAKRWPEVARIRRQQASALYAEAGEPVPPSDEVVALQRDALLADLRALAEVSARAELVGTGCCRACKADDSGIFPIAAELRQPRLPHAGCPKGLCGCQWWLATPEPKSSRGKRRRRSVPSGSPATASPTPDLDPDGDVAHQTMPGGLY